MDREINVKKLEKGKVILYMHVKFLRISNHLHLIINLFWKFLFNK